VLAVDFEANMEALVGPRRIPQGVLVASPAPGVALESTPFEFGDVIVELNARRVRNVRELRQGLAATASAVDAVQVERHQRLPFVTVEP
jgi:S1-C subfamily serine protease